MLSWTARSATSPAPLQPARSRRARTSTAPARLARCSSRPTSLSAAELRTTVNSQEVQHAAQGHDPLGRRTDRLHRSGRRRTWRRDRHRTPGGVGYARTRRSCCARATRSRSPSTASALYQPGDRRALTALGRFARSALERIDLNAFGACARVRRVQDDVTRGGQLAGGVGQRRMRAVSTPNTASSLRVSDCRSATCDVEGLSYGPHHMWWPGRIQLRSPAVQQVAGRPVRRESGQGTGPDRS